MPMIERPKFAAMYLALPLLIAAGPAQVALADVLVLTNGDRITGDVKHIWDDKVTIEPEYSDPFDVDLAAVAHIESDRELDVKLDDGFDGTGTLVGAADDGKQVLATPDGPREIALADLFEVQEPEDYTDWDSHIDFASSLNRGNTDSENTKLRADGVYKRGDHRHRGELTFYREQLDGVRTQEQNLYTYDYNWLFSDPWFFSSELTYERDPIIDLDHRITLSAGIGYDIWKTPRKELSVKLGAGFQDEETATTSNESAVAVWALRFRHEFLGGDFSVFHNHTITDNLSGRDNTIFKTSTGLNYAISELLYSNVSLDFDYETHPVDFADHEDLALLLGLGFEFD
jgi:putative salt-induced outer membrane protein YdiY